MKSRTTPMIAMLGLVLLAGCVGTGVSVEQALPEVAVAGTLPERTRTVVVVPVQAKPDAIRNTGAVTGVPQLFARSVRDALADRRPNWEFRVALNERDGSPRDVTVTTEVLEIDGGSAGLRFWLGFAEGAGATQSRAKVTLLDGNGKPIASADISESGSCSWGACLDTNEEMVRAGIQRLAADAAEFAVNPVVYLKRKPSNP